MRGGKAAPHTPNPFDPLALAKPASVALPAALFVHDRGLAALRAQVTDLYRVWLRQKLKLARQDDHFLGMETVAGRSGLLILCFLVRSGAAVLFPLGFNHLQIFI